MTAADYKGWEDDTVSLEFYDLVQSCLALHNTENYEIHVYM